MSKAKAKAKATTVTKTTNAVDNVPGPVLDNSGTINSNDEAVKDYSKETHEAMRPYVKAYPDAKHFLIASDGQVFLPANEQDAKVHQKGLDDKKELVKYHVSK